jgi:hypothetical protein
VSGMLPDTWWWPWWVSSLIDVVVMIAALVAFRFSRRRAVRALAVLVAVGLVAAVLAPVVMTDQSDQHMRNEPAMRGGTR